MCGGANLILSDCSLQNERNPRIVRAEPEDRSLQSHMNAAERWAGSDDERGSRYFVNEAVTLDGFAEYESRL